MRTAHLDEGVAVAGQRERTTEVNLVVELQVQFFVPGRPQHNVRRVFQHPQNHRAGGDADAPQNPKTPKPQNPKTPYYFNYNT